MTPKDTNEQDNLSLHKEGLSLSDAEKTVGENQAAASAPNPWDTARATTTNTSTEHNQATYHTDFNEPYVSTSTSTINRDITFKEFYKNYCSPVVKKNINGSAIALYICCGVTALLSFTISALGLDIMASLIDAILMLGLALGIHIGKSRACAIIILIYSLINCLSSLVATGRLGGYLIVIAAIYATIYTFRARKEYKDYINA